MQVQNYANVVPLQQEQYNMQAQNHVTYPLVSYYLARNCLSMLR